MPVTFPKWLLFAYMVKKKPFNSSTPEPVDLFHEIRYVARGAQTYHSLFKLCPWIDRILFMARLGFSKGNNDKSGVFKNCCSLY